MSTSNHCQAAGLTVRCSAAAADVSLVLAFTFGIVGLGRISNRYIPLELTFLLAWTTQTVLFTICSHRTPGKWLLGLVVQRVRGGQPGILRLVLRETAARLMALLPLGLGMWWIGIPPAKRGWHDYLTRTRVIQEPTAARRRRWTMRIAALGLVFVLSSVVAPRAWIYVCAARMAPSASVPPSPSAPPRDVQTVLPVEYPSLARWLDIHGQLPEEYAIAAAADHQLTIFGEFHHVADNLRFLMRIIPDLYHRAGVRCLAMEALVSHDDAALQQLVTAAKFDRGQAVGLMRHEGWKSWGSREYVDVLEAVWGLNRTLSADQPPLRVIGLDREWDMPSWALVGLGDDARPGPWWERLRLLRVLLDLPLMVRRDELMALQIEQQIFANRQRAVVWVGAAHAYTDYAQPFAFGDSSSKRRHRMGAILRHRYGEQFCHLRLHDSAYEGSALAALIEAVQAARGHAAVGFDLAGSPFAELRDRAGLEYRRDSKARFADFATGYLYLKPLRDQKRCTWETGFITRAMFLRDRPYYEAQNNRRLRDADEANQAFRRQWGE